MGRPSAEPRRGAPPLPTRARLLRPTVAADRRVIERLRHDPVVDTFDEIGLQLGELLARRVPPEHRALLSDEAVAELVAAHLRGTPLSDHGVWAYYPWSRRLVHLLPEDEFVELRTAGRAVGAGARKRLDDRAVGVVGLGVGHVVALALASARSCGELRLADPGLPHDGDPDVLHGAVHELGVPQVVRTSRAIAEVDPFLHVDCPQGGVGERSASAFVAGLDLVVLASGDDVLDAALARACAAQRIPTVRAGGDVRGRDVSAAELLRSGATTAAVVRCHLLALGDEPRHRHARALRRRSAARRLHLA
jgi:hypothetical protein